MSGLSHSLQSAADFLKTEDVKEDVRPYTSDPKKRMRSRSGEQSRATRRQKIGEPIVERVISKGSKRMASASTFGEKDKKIQKRESSQGSMERAPVKGKRSVSGRSATPRRLSYTPSPDQGRGEERSFQGNPEGVGSSSSDGKNHVDKPHAGLLTKEDQDNFAKQLFAQIHLSDPAKAASYQAWWKQQQEALQSFQKTLKTDGNQ